MAAIMDKFSKSAIRLGAKGAKLVSTQDVFTAPWVRLKCRFGCDGYGRSLTCPPYSPTPEEMRRILDCYKKAVLIQCSEETHCSVTEIAVALEREIFLSGYYKAYGLGAGPCNICNRCNLKECSYPDRARPSMEASGIDVFKTVRKAGFFIEVLTTTKCQPNYYGLVLID